VPDEADGWVELYGGVLRTGEPIRFERELEITGRHLELAAFRIDPPERRQVAVLFQDVTKRHRAELALRDLNDSLEQRVAEEVAERLKTEEALRQAQKMEAVGQLTGGIAHDFNNMLAVVIGSLDLLSRRFVADDARAKRYVDAAKDGAKRAAQLTQRLLAFSRQQPLRPEPVDANKLVAGMSDLLHHSLGGAIRLETVLAGGLWRVHADPNQLESVILNLAVNGRDAMAEGGRLTIETANSHLDQRYAAEHIGLPAGQYVLIAVSDTGSGMSPEIVAKAFDPFFTTKEVGRGTGLGLSQVYGFVKQSGGHVKIYSEVGEGTVVKVYLPRLIGAPSEDAEPEAESEVPLGDQREVVLVVEDEPAVRQLSVDALVELGYRVLEADGAAAALKLIDAHPEIALLFTDVVMPEVNGRKLADEALKRRPDLKVLFTTGYTQNAVVHNGVLDPGVELIGKPFTIEELAARVREVLDSPD
ncbi:MAG: response regulator, partial [Burkholderiales bacterium]|nr:response regulator [Burkholderiales bacterium]